MRSKISEFHRAIHGGIQGISVEQKCSHPVDRRQGRVSAVTASVAILHHMARSGGTLISKCIGCMDSIALLSEVHPLTASGQFNPLFQANSWLGIDVPAELKALGEGQNINWLQAIELIHRCVKARGEKLVVRDWSHLDYTGVPWVQPTYQLNTAKVLGSKFEIHQAFSVRHPIDQWNSLTKLGVIAGKLDVNAYLKGYRAFAEQAAELGYVRYEDFTANPAKYLKILCTSLDIPYDPDFVSKWFSYTSITGDVSSDGPGRATEAKDITPLRRHEPEPEILAAFRRCPDFGVSLEILGYEE